MWMLGEVSLFYSMPTHVNIDFCLDKNPLKYPDPSHSENQRLKSPLNISLAHIHKPSEFCSILLYYKLIKPFLNDLIIILYSTFLVQQTHNVIWTIKKNLKGNTKKGKKKCNKSEGALTTRKCANELTA